MNDCTKVRGLIFRYLKDELDKKRRLYVESHTRNCIMCSTEMEFARKKQSVADLLSSLQPQPTFLKKIGNIPKSINQKIKRPFLRYPIVMPALLILLFVFLPLGIYIKRYNLPKEGAININTNAIVQITPEAKKPDDIKDANAQPKQEKKDEEKDKKKENPAELKIVKKDERPEQKKVEARKEEVIKNIQKVDENIEVKKGEEKLGPSLFKLSIKTELQPDIVFAKVESISERLNALILFAKGFSAMDSDSKKEILVRMNKENYMEFQSLLKNQFTEISSEADKNIRIPTDITKDETQSFILIEVN